MHLGTIDCTSILQEASHKLTACAPRPLYTYSATLCLDSILYSLTLYSLPTLYLLGHSIPRLYTLFLHSILLGLFTAGRRLITSHTRHIVLSYCWPQAYCLTHMAPKLCCLSAGRRLLASALVPAAHCAVIVLFSAFLPLYSQSYWTYTSDMAPFNACYDKVKAAFIDKFAGIS